MGMGKLGKTGATLGALGATFVGFAAVGLPSLASRDAKAAFNGSAVAIPTSISPAGRQLVDGAALVEGTVGTITFSYDDVTGPRTNVHFFVDKLHEGSIPASQLTLSVFGGYLPSGQFMTTSETPVFAEGQRCLLLLTNKSAFWSPIVPGYGFSIESVDGEDMLIGDEGRAVVSIGVLGPKFGSEALFQSPRFDGFSFQRATRLAAAPSTRTLKTSEAVDAIRAVLRSDGVRLAGALGSTKPTWSRWNETPVSGELQ